MEHGLAIKHQFVELRVVGESLAAIAARLDVARSTVQHWQAEFASDIARLRRVAWEDNEADVAFRLEDELLRLGRWITGAEDDLRQRPIADRSILTLVRLLRLANDEYHRARAILMKAEHTQARAARLAKIGACADFRPIRPRGTRHLRQIENENADSQAHSSLSTLNPQLSTLLIPPSLQRHPMAFLTASSCKVPQAGSFFAR